MGIRPPALTAEQREGTHVEAVLAGQQLAQKLAAYEAFKREREAFARERDEKLWARIIARQRAAL